MNASCWKMESSFWKWRICYIIFIRDAFKMLFLKHRSDEIILDNKVFFLRILKYFWRACKVTDMKYISVQSIWQFHILSVEYNALWWLQLGKNHKWIHKIQNFFTVCQELLLLCYLFFGTWSIINARCFHLSVCRKAEGEACESLIGV